MEIARYWRMNAQRYTLTGTVCTSCGKPYFSPRPVCEACAKEAAAARGAVPHPATPVPALRSR